MRGSLSDDFGMDFLDFNRKCHVYKWTIKQLLVGNKLCCVYIINCRCDSKILSIPRQDGRAQHPCCSYSNPKFPFFSRAKARNLALFLLPSGFLLSAVPQPACASDLSRIMCRRSLPSRRFQPRVSEAAGATAVLLE